MLNVFKFSNINLILKCSDPVPKKNIINFKVLLRYLILVHYIIKDAYGLLERQFNNI